MPTRLMAARELAAFLGVLGHPDRVRIVGELRRAERDVNALQEALGVTHSRASQNLAILRAHRIVTERREGRHVYYRLSQPAVAEWLLSALRFVEADLADVVERRRAVEAARQRWSWREPPARPGRKPAGRKRS
ncbi:MAG: ArsR/SmtB family transcription factor [Vicinamibacterales bacterium]